MDTMFRLVWSVAVAVALAGCGVTGNDAERTGSRSAVGGAASLPAFFVDNAVTEIRYARVAMHEQPKPEKVLSLKGLSQERVELLVQADVASWKREYEDDRVRDGMRWVVEFVGGGRVVKRVDGFNAEPPGLKYLLEACGIRRRTDADRDF